MYIAVTAIKFTARSGLATPFDTSKYSEITYTLWIDRRMHYVTLPDDTAKRARD